MGRVERGKGICESKAALGMIYKIIMRRDEGESLIWNLILFHGQSGVIASQSVIFMF